jgi:small subunit ribosomal protein S16
VEVLGHYNPHSKELALNKERLGTRVSQGAQPSNTVLRLMVREGMELPKWAKLAQKQRAPKKEVEVKADASAEPAPEASDAEAPAQETVADAVDAKN